MMLKSRACPGPYQPPSTLNMTLFAPAREGGDVRLDAAYQECLPEFSSRSRVIEPADLPAALALLFAPERVL